MKLSEGSHRLRIEVAEKRAFDGRYYFYLDSLFFLNREKLNEIDQVKPAVFPATLDSSSVDNPFLSITDYENYINSNPDDMSAYIELSLVFSLLGDYQNSLKTLTKAMALDASDPYPIVLAAKNRLWKGDVRESLDLYERALNVDPDDQTLWAEAGKVAAWSAEYDRSIDFFSRGLERFPDNLNMRVNLALTYLWMARDDDSQQAFNAAFEEAKDDPEKLSELGWIEEANGYPGKAQETYEKAIGIYPEYLEFYLLLQSSYLASGDRDAADEVGKRIESTFISSQQLQNRMEIYKRKLNLRDEVIESYQVRLKAEPGNLELRQELAQTFFWNGMSSEAIEQIKYVITTHSFRAAETYVRRNAELLELLDGAAAILPFFTTFQSESAAAGKAIGSAASELQKALKAVEASAQKEPEDAAAAKSALREAEQNYADAIAAAGHLATHAEDMALSVEEYEAAVTTLLEAEKAEDEAFRKAVEASGWSWDKSWQINELSGIMEDERALAAYMLSRVLMSEKHYSRAASVITPEAGTQELSAERLYTLYQAFLLGGDGEGRKNLLAEDGARLIEEYPHITEIEQRMDFSEKMLEDAPAGVYFEGLELESTKILSELDKYGEDLANERKRTALLINQLSAIAAKELERTNYYLEADTYLIRYELGTYYLEEGMNFEAAEQFRRVIAVDPWNISAAYKLGVVEQRYGNWFDAMKYYKKVYQQDPGYENTIYYYNQLARAHADKTSAGIQLINSPAEIALAGSLGWSTEFNSFIGMGIRYNLDQQRLYRNLEGEEKGSFQVHSIEASVPFTFNTIGLTLTPMAGIYAESLYYKEDIFFFNGGEDVSGDYVPADAVTIPEFLGTISTFPRYGVSLGWNRSFLTVEASWQNAIEPDTFYADREIIRKNDIELNANTWFDFEKDLLGPLTTRTYGRLQFMGDEAGNIKWQVYQNLMFGLNILSSPITRLSPSVTFNYEDSRDEEGEGYYAPQGVMELKGGLRSSFIFPAADWSRAFEAVVWGAGGGYWSDFTYESVKAEAGIEANWIKNSNHYYFNAAWLQTFNADDTKEYWEISLSLGTNLYLPGLLTK